MGHKAVCLDCQKAFSQGTDITNIREIKCPNCGKDVILLPHRFRPPKHTDNLKWKVIKYLIENGFYFQHIHEPGNNYNSSPNYAPYPETLSEAKIFVEKYSTQAKKKTS